MSVSISAAFFFVVWGILHDSGEEMPWITAGVSASMLLCGAVLLREVILRRARARLLRQQRQMERRFAFSTAGIMETGQPRKLTLERNAAILDDIRRKSEAARVLSKFSAGHREVFELCSEYIAHNESELKSVNVGSPRLAALLKGRNTAAEIHRYHMLRWTEIEVTVLTEEARGQSESRAKIDAAQGAMDVIQRSLADYPAETSLLQSRDLLREMVVSIKVSEWVEKAERASFDRDLDLARSLYREALFELGSDNISSQSRETAARRINEEIDRIRASESSR